MKIRRFDSEDDSVFKYVFDFGDAVAEAVLYRHEEFEERTVICVSTQSGCPVGCRFCGAGNAFVRSLTCEEIVSQVLWVFADQAIFTSAVKKLQIMFMSMGEPMLNFTALRKAMARLGRAYLNAELLISTSAPDVDYAPLRRISAIDTRIGLQFSVHESTDEARNRLIPFKAKLDLAGIAAEGTAWSVATGRMPFLNYCAKEDNTSDEDADRLRALFHPAVWQVTVSVVCESSESVAVANDRQLELAQSFMAKMLKRGYSVRCFNPAGQDDIGGGCGQLWFVQDWMREHPSLSSPTAGADKPRVHVPS